MPKEDQLISVLDTVYPIVSDALFDASSRGEIVYHDRLEEAAREAISSLDVSPEFRKPSSLREAILSSLQRLINEGRAPGVHRWEFRGEDFTEGYSLKGAPVKVDEHLGNFSTMFPRTVSEGELHNMGPGEKWTRPKTRLI